MKTKLTAYEVAKLIDDLEQRVYDEVCSRVDEEEIPEQALYDEVDRVRQKIADAFRIAAA